MRRHSRRLRRRNYFVMLTQPPAEKGLHCDVSGRGRRTIFATAQPSPTEKKLLRDADTAAYGEETAS